MERKKKESLIKTDHKTSSFRSLFSIYRLRNLVWLYLKTPHDMWVRESFLCWDEVTATEKVTNTIYEDIYV